MFDWARGSLLKALIARNVYKADWHSADWEWLKHWNTSWFMPLVEFTSGMRVLDVGSSYPELANELYHRFGCDAHALDAPTGDFTNANFGFQQSVHKDFPSVSIHFGLAGQDTLPAEHFDVIFCISAIEHMYDSISPMDPSAPLAHISALRDMCRMLRPGGLLLMNWDVYLSGVPHHIGWDFQSDFWLLEHCGMRLADSRRKIRSGRYIFDHPETLFFAPRVVAPYSSTTLLHGASINAVWVKPGGLERTKFQIPGELEQYYLPSEEVQHVNMESARELSHSDVEARFQAYTRRAVAALGHPLAGC